MSFAEKKVIFLFSFGFFFGYHRIVSLHNFISTVDTAVVDLNPICPRLEKIIKNKTERYRVRGNKLLKYTSIYGVVKINLLKYFEIT